MQIRNSLRKLKSTGEITVLTTAEYSIITVKNYNIYQDDNRLKNRQTTSEEQTSNRQATTTNKDNNIYSNNIISLSNKKKNLSKNEREILKNYLLNKKRSKPIEDVDAYIALLVKNGDVSYILAKAKKWHEKQEQKKQEVKIAAETKITEPQVSKEEREAGMQKVREAVAKIRKGIK